MTSTLKYILIWLNSADQAKNDNVQVVRHFNENIRNNILK